MDNHSTGLAALRLYIVTVRGDPSQFVLSPLHLPNRSQQVVHYPL